MGRVNAFSPDAAEAEVACRCVDLLGMARSRPIASAIVRRAQVRAALDDLARDPDVRRGRVVAAVLAPAARVLRDAAGFRRVAFVLLRVPVGRPFPDVTNHVPDEIKPVRQEIRRCQATSLHSRQQKGFDTETRPARCWPSVFRLAAYSSPHAYSLPRPARRAPQLPFRFGRQAHCPPISHTLLHLDMRDAQPDDCRALPEVRIRQEPGCFQSAPPGTQCHQLYAFTHIHRAAWVSQTPSKSRGTSISGSAPG